MNGHWEGEMTTVGGNVIVLLDIFDDYALFSLPAKHVFGLKGRYYCSEDVFNIYIEQDHPITINSLRNKELNRIKGVISQEDDTFDFYCEKSLLKSIGCGINDRYGYYKNLLRCSSLMLDDYYKVTNIIKYDFISGTYKQKILGFYNIIKREARDIADILELMNTVHLKFEHTSIFTPDYLVNSLSIIEHTPKKINCRAFAILFNELALAVGLKSRYVTCLPYKNWENDCHVVNEVYVESFQKWILVDANIGTVIKNSKGEYLNIYEYRKAFFDEENCELVNTASYNGKRMEINDYNTYMVKNLFRFEFKIKYGLDSEKNRKIMLNPYIE